MKFDLLSTLQSPTYLSWSCSAGIISTKARCTIMYLYLCYVCIFSDKLQSVCKRKSAHFITFFCLQVGIQTSLPTYFLPAAIIVSTTTYIYNTMQIVKLSSNFVKFCFGKNIYSSNVIYLSIQYYKIFSSFPNSAQNSKRT